MCVVLYIILYSRWWWWMRLITHMHLLCVGMTLYLNHYMLTCSETMGSYIKLIFRQLCLFGSSFYCQIFSTYNIIINNFVTILSCCKNDGLPVNHIFGGYCLMSGQWSIFIMLFGFFFLKEKFNECTHSAEPSP